MASMTIHHWSMGHSTEGYFQTDSISFVGGVASPNRTYIKPKWDYGHDSAYGWSFQYSYTINASKTVNYIRYLISPINRVGDVLTDQLGQSTKLITCTGPVIPGTEYQAKVKNIWYTPQTITPRFEEVVFCYSDGTEESVPVYIQNNYNDVEYFDIFYKGSRHSSNGANEQNVLLWVFIGVICILFFLMLEW